MDRNLTSCERVRVFTEPSGEKPLRVLHGDTRDVIRSLPDDTFHCVITSPPYWGVRDYGISGQIGAEPDLNDYVRNLVAVFAEVRRVLHPEWKKASERGPGEREL